MTSFYDEEPTADGGRIIDIGGTHPASYEEAPDGKNLVIFALDPGITSGWSALKVPVATLRGQGVARTLARCRWRHGEIRRSVTGQGDRGVQVSDSRHVNLIQEQMLAIYEEFVFDVDSYVEAHEDDKGWDPAVVEDWESDEYVFVFENFRLRMMSMDDNLLAPQRILDKVCDRLWVAKSQTPVFFQSPSDAKNTVTDDRLKRWMMYDKGSGPHARDADRHAILFLRRFLESRDLQSRLGFA